MATRKEIVEAIHKAGTAGIYMDKKTADKLVKEELVTINTAIAPDVSGNVAVVGTEKLNAEFASADSTAPIEKQKVVVTRSLMDELPAKSKSAGKPEQYPFDSLAAPTVGADGKTQYDTFFVAGKDAKKFASTVASAERRFGIPDPTGATRKSRKEGAEPVVKTILQREFEVFDATDNGQSGIRVYRTK